MNYFGSFMNEGMNCRPVGKKIYLSGVSYHRRAVLFDGGRFTFGPI